MSTSSISDDGKTIAFVANEDGFGALHLLDTETRKEKPMPACSRALSRA
jgi:hypothetical protein